MIIPARYPYSIYKGDSFDLSLNYKDDTGNLYDLTSYSATLRFYATEGLALLYEFSNADRDIVLSATEFNVVIKISKEKTATLEFGWSKKAYSHLELTAPDLITKDRLLESLVTLHD